MPCLTTPLQIHLIIWLQGFIFHWNIIVNNQINLHKKEKSQDAKLKTPRRAY
jgi:hypothetical protein